MSSNLNIRDLYNLSKRKNVPLFGDSTTLATLPFMAEYLANYQKFDRNTAVTRGFFQPLWNLQYESTDEDVLSAFRSDVEILLLKNKKNYEKLYAITLAEYNPLENYKKPWDNGTNLPQI